MKTAPQFRDYVTRVAFNLTLSRSQMFALWFIAEKQKLPTDDYSLLVKDRRLQKLFGFRVDTFIAGSRGLLERGLVMHEDSPKKNEPFWKLTEAGEHVLALLKLADLVPTTKVLA